MNVFELNFEMDNMNGFNRFLKDMKAENPFLVKSVSDDGSDDIFYYDLTNLVRKMYLELRDKFLDFSEEELKEFNDTIENNEPLVFKYTMKYENILNEYLKLAKGGKSLSFVDPISDKIFYIKDFQNIIKYLFKNILTFLITEKVKMIISIKNLFGIVKQ